MPGQVSKAMLIGKHVLRAQIRNNLSSISESTSLECKAVFERSTCRIECSDEVIKDAVKSGNLHYLRVFTEEYTEYALESRLSLWHIRIGHIKIANLKLVLNTHSIEAKLQNGLEENFCERCIFEKQL